MVEVGNIRGLKEFEPDGKQRILLRRLLEDWGSVSAKFGRPQAPGPNDELDRIELGREDGDGADRYDIDVRDRWSKKPDCLDFILASGDPIASSNTGTEKA